MSDIMCDVAIVGAGPAGIAAATALKEAGIQNIIVFEREPEAGGIPRHIHHPTFGLLVYHRPMSGPKFTQTILSKCEGVKFEFNTSVIAIQTGGALTIAGINGIRNVQARHIILATGAREKPRHARLVSGLRPQGIMSTGALQKFIYGAGLCPFKRPIIVGTELASFSALSTLKSAGAKAAAMIEKNPRITAYRPAIGFAALMGTPIKYNSHIVDIGGLDRVEFVRIEGKKGTQRIACDGVIFSGDFVGETALTKTCHLKNNPSSRLPLVDQNWISSDPQISIIGNCVHPADMGDQCYLEGLDAGRHVANLLHGQHAIASEQVILIDHDTLIKMTTPSAITKVGDGTVRFDIHLHVNTPYWGKIEVLFEGENIYSKTHRCLPARRIALKNIWMRPRDKKVTEANSMSKLEIVLGSANHR